MAHLESTASAEIERRLREQKSEFNAAQQQTFEKQNLETKRLLEEQSRQVKSAEEQALAMYKQLESFEA